MTVRQRIETSARTWIGTPWHHRASCREAGADCLGLIRGVWRDVIGPEPELLPPYTDDWSTLRNCWDVSTRLASYFTPLAVSSARPGDVILLCISPRSGAEHLAILAQKGDVLTLIHSYQKHGVIEQTYSPSWRRRAVQGFCFPERLS